MLTLRKLVILSTRNDVFHERCNVFAAGDVFDAFLPLLCWNFEELVPDRRDGSLGVFQAQSRRLDGVDIQRSTLCLYNLNERVVS